MVRVELYTREIHGKIYLKKTIAINNFEYLFELENHNEKLFHRILLSIRHAMQLYYDFLSGAIFLLFLYLSLPLDAVLFKRIAPHKT